MIRALDGKWGKGVVSTSSYEITFVGKSISIPFAIIQELQIFNSQQKMDKGDVVKVGGSAAILGGAVGGPLGALAGVAFGALTANTKNTTVFGIVTKGGDAAVFEADTAEFIKLNQYYESSKSIDYDDEEINELQESVFEQEQRDFNIKLFGGFIGAHIALVLVGLALTPIVGLIWFLLIGIICLTVMYWHFTDEEIKIMQKSGGGAFQRLQKGWERAKLGKMNLILSAIGFFVFLVASVA